MVKLVISLVRVNFLQDLRSSEYKAASISYNFKLFFYRLCLLYHVFFIITLHSQCAFNTL